MSNVMIVIILTIAVFIGLKETIKHFKGEGACCGGASSKPKKKKLRRLMHRNVKKEMQEQLT